MSEEKYEPGRSRRRRSTKQKRPKSFFGCIGALFFIGLLVAGGAGLGYYFYRINQTTERIQVTRPAEQETMRDDVEDLIQDEEAFSVLLLGIDSDSDSGVENGRSDIIVFVTVNPADKNMTLTSIPRDTLTYIPGYGSEDKINHAYAYGGVSMAANTIQDLLEVPVDYTISANMQGFSDVIDALDGITITPLDTFQQDGYEFIEGQTVTMSGGMALAYTRNRYDTGGDYSRQERARQLVSAIIDEASSINSIWNLPPILNALEDNVLTDLTMDDIRYIASNYREAVDSVETMQLNGTGRMIDGIYYEIIDEESLEQIQQKLKEELDYNQ